MAVEVAKAGVEAEAEVEAEATVGVDMLAVVNRQFITVCHRLDWLLLVSRQISLRAGDMTTIAAVATTAEAGAEAEA